jgi:hypothetical protein
MGTEAIWIPLAVSAISAGAAAKNQHDTLQRQDNEAAAGIAAQAGRQRQADARVSQEVQALEASSPEAERARATNDFLGQLRQARGAQYNANGVGASSDEFAKDTAAGAGKVVDFGKASADRMARISAPGRQRVNEQVSFGRAAGDVNQIARGAQGDAFLTQLRMRGIQANPWIGAASQLGQGVASGMAQSSGYGSTDDSVSLDNGYQFTNRAPRPRYG